MKQSENFLRERFAALLRWERAKRREKILTTALFWSLALSLPTLVIRPIGVIAVDPLFIPVGLFLLSSLGALSLRRWGRKDSLRTIFCLDRTLAMEDRGLTAWEILSRQNHQPAEELVLDEAATHLTGFDPKRTFSRPFPWYGVGAVAVLAVWLAAARSGMELGSAATGRDATVAASARTLKEFLERLKDKAEMQGLAETLEITRKLLEIAERRLKNEVSEELFREQLGQALNRLEAMQRGDTEKLQAALFPVSRANLEGLAAEVEEFRRQLREMGSDVGDKRLQEQIGQKLAQLPQLRQALQNSQALRTEAPAEREPDAAQLKSLLEQLDGALKSELEHSAQGEIQEFLASVVASAETDGSEQLAQEEGDAEPESAAESEMQRRVGRLPGKQPGAKGGGEDRTSVEPGYTGQIKGQVQEGERTRFRVPGQNPIGTSKEKEQAVLTHYQRQVERDLATEEIPDHLKDTIKQYFLSLGGDRQGK